MHMAKDVASRYAVMLDAYRRAIQTASAKFQARKTSLATTSIKLCPTCPAAPLKIHDCAYRNVHQASHGGPLTQSFDEA